MKQKIEFPVEKMKAVDMDGRCVTATEAALGEWGGEWDIFTTFTVKAKFDGGVIAKSIERVIRFRMMVITNRIHIGFDPRINVTA